MTFRMSQAEVQAHQAKLQQWRSGEAPKRPGRKAKATKDTFAYEAAKIEAGRLTVSLPVKLVNIANEREHWADRSKRAKAHRDIVAQAMPRRVLPPLPVEVTITRYGPKLMDDDGNTIACKSIRDGIAGQFCLDDGSPLIRFQCAQEKGEYGVKVEIKPRGTGEGE